MALFRRPKTHNERKQNAGLRAERDPGADLPIKGRDRTGAKEGLSLPSAWSDLTPVAHGDRARGKRRHSRAHKAAVALRAALFKP